MIGPPITGLEWEHPYCSRCGHELPFMFAIHEVYIVAVAFMLAGVALGYLVWGIHG